MKHLATKKFWQYHDKLPVDIQQLAKANYRMLKRDLSHPSLNFKKVRNHRTVRIGLSYRAIGIEVSEGVLWFWIGHHKEYDRLLKIL